MAQFPFHPHLVCCRRLLGRRCREQPKLGLATALAGRRPELSLGSPYNRRYELGTVSQLLFWANLGPATYYRPGHVMLRGAGESGVYYSCCT